MNESYRCKRVVVCWAAIVAVWGHVAHAGVWVSHGPEEGNIVDPSSPATIYATSGSVAFKSTDGAKS